MLCRLPTAGHAVWGSDPLSGRTIREAVPAVGGAGLADASADFQTLSVQKVGETVAPQRGIALKFTLVHVPQLQTADEGVFRADVHDILYGKRLCRQAGKGLALVMLVIGLLAYAKQRAKGAHGISAGCLCVQVTYCLAPGFFLMGMLNSRSAMFIISS